MDEGTESRIGVHDMVIEVDTGLNLDGEEAFREIPRLDPPDDRRTLARLLLLFLSVALAPLPPLTVTLTILLRSVIVGWLLCEERSNNRVDISSFSRSISFLSVSLDEERHSLYKATRTLVFLAQSSFAFADGLRGFTVAMQSSL